jgi:hypothetical protein
MDFENVSYARNDDNRIRIIDEIIINELEKQQTRISKEDRSLWKLIVHMFDDRGSMKRAKKAILRVRRAYDLALLSISPVFVVYARN